MLEILSHKLVIFYSDINFKKMSRDIIKFCVEVVDLRCLPAAHSLTGYKALQSGL